MMSFSWFSRLAMVVFTAQGFFITSILAKTKAKSSSGTNFDARARPGQYACPCGKSFETQSRLLQHMTATGHDKKYKGKSDIMSQEDNLTNTPPKRHTLYRSKSIDRDDKVESLKERRRSIDELEKDSIAIDKHEHRNAVTEYSYNVRKIIDHIRTQKSGKIYSADYRKAGSYSMKTKVGKADEFDTNIVLKIDVKGILTEGKLGYIYDDKKALDDKRSLPRKIKSARRLKDISKNPLPIPHGQAVVQVKDPSTLLHLTHNGDLIPYKVLQDLHGKVEAAIKDLGLSNVKLLPTSQGPALTITIKQQNYDIDVDLVPSLPCDLPVTLNNWPRKETRKAFRQEKVNAVIKAGLHLVPKGDETWTISYSKAERELLYGIDDNNECRREVMRIMKKYLETCKEESPNGLPGLSSHIVKIQILWSSENRIVPGYWSQKYKDRCLLDTIDDMVHSLESKNLPEYFDENINTLAYKPPSELQYFARCLKKQKSDLEKLGGGKIKDEL